MRLVHGPRLRWAETRKSVSVLKADLKTTGIPYSTHKGDFDVHALRGRHTGELVQTVANLKVAQRLMRHSSVTLMMNV